MYEKEHLEILATVQSGVKEYGLKKLNEPLGVSIGNLYACIDPNSVGRRSNKLGLLEWLRILDLTGNLDSLDKINNRYNRISISIPNTIEFENRTWLRFCAAMAKESGEAMTSLAVAIADGVMDKNELRNCMNETMDAMEVFAGLYLTMKSQLEGLNQ